MNATSTKSHATPAADTALEMLDSERWPTFAADEVAAVVEVLESGRVNQWTGDRVFGFEREYDDHLGHGRRSIALANGSVALELALRALDIGEGDEVIVTPRTFVASAFCAMLVGATPVFADVDPDSGNLTPESIEAAVTSRTKAVIPVHLAGWPADMPGIMRVAEENDLVVVEDCAQAHGASIDGRPVGTFGHASAFSFCQDKILTTGGEGGLVAFADEHVYEWAWSFKDHGMNREKRFEPVTKPGFRWERDSVGTNWRMLESSAAIGSLQLAKLPTWHRLRSERASIWADALRDVPGLRVPTVPAGYEHASYKHYAYVDRGHDRNESLRDEILARIAASGLRSFSGSCSEVYLEDAFRHLHVDRLPTARALGESSLMFEVHPTLDADRLRARAQVVAEIARTVLD